MPKLWWCHWKIWTKEKCPGSDSRHESQRQVAFVPPPSLVTRCIQLAGAALDSLALNVALSTGVAADKAGVAGKCFRKSLKIIMPLINGIHRISVLNLVSVVLFGCMVAMILGCQDDTSPKMPGLCWSVLSWPTTSQAGGRGVGPLGGGGANGTLFSRCALLRQNISVNLKLPRLSSFLEEKITTWMVSLWDILFFCGLLNDLLFLWQKSSHLFGILWVRPHWGCLLQYSDQSLCPASQLQRCLWGAPLSVPLDLGMPPPLPVARYWIGWSRGRYILIQLHLTQPWTQNSGDAFYRYF